MSDDAPSVSVKLDRFCADCGLYDLKVTRTRPSRRLSAKEERAAWLAAQHEKAAALRAASAGPPEAWRCAGCGGGNYRIVRVTAR